MISIPSMDRYFARYPSFSGLIYVAVVVVFCLATIFLLADIVEQYRARNASLDVLSRLEGGNQHLHANVNIGSWPTGSPFLEGKSATVASATLLQRVTSIITRAGGTIISSAIERQGTQSKDGYVSVMATCEIEQTALQKVLYDIEAGMPFLFVDQLGVQALTTSGDTQRMQVVLAVSGKWPGAK